MKKKHFCALSLIFNGVFIVFILLAGFKFKENILQEFIGRKEKATIVMFGDSIIKGGKWNELLGRNDVKNSGFGGFTTSHLRWLIKKNVIAYSPKYCFLEGGINDIGVGIPLTRVKENYKCLLDTLIANDIIPVVQSTLYQENDSTGRVKVDSLNMFLREYCDSKAIRFLDINSKLSTRTGLKKEYSKDGTHITEDAYLIWNDEIRKILDELESQGDNNGGGSM
jgi:alpha-glucosidase